MTIQYGLKSLNTNIHSNDLLALMCPSNNCLDLQVPVERLVEEETGLEV